MRPEIQFSSAFPDDSIEDVGGFVQWPGHNVAEALKAALEERGYLVSEPVDAQHVGWELDIWRGRKRLWLQISMLEPELNYLMAKNMTFFLWPDVKLFRTRPGGPAGYPGSRPPIQPSSLVPKWRH